MKEALFIRKGKRITDVKTGVVTTHTSISAAKRWSMHKQKSIGILGDGQVRVDRSKEKSNVAAV